MSTIAKYGAGVGIGNPSSGLSTRQGVWFASSANTAMTQQFIFSAEVMEIDLNRDTPLGIGRIKFRMLSNSGRDVKSLDWALPLASQIKSYPVLHETVAILYIGGAYYYITPINLDNYINNNNSVGLTDETNILAQRNMAKSYQESQSNGMPEKTNVAKKDELGKDFINQKSAVPILLPNVGDTIIQGRFGNSIRFGYTKKSNMPSMKLSLIHDRNTSYKYHEENLDTDDGIWIVSDEEFIFKKIPTSINSKNNPPHEYKGRQCIISSSRIIFNAKENEILMFSNKGINLACNKNFSIDTDSLILINSKNTIDIKSKSQILLTSTSETILNASKIYLGGKNSAEKMVKGETIVKLIENLIDIMLNHKHMATAPGAPTLPMMPPEVGQISQLKAKLNTALSRINYNV